MLLKDLLSKLDAYKPFHYCGAERTEVSFLVEDYSLLPGLGGVYVIDDITLRPSPCEVLITCVECLDHVPASPPITNVVLVDIKHLSEVKKLVAEIFKAA